MDPATCFIEKLLEKLLDYTINALGRQVGYMIFYRNNIDELRSQIQDLNQKQEAMQHLIDEAIRNCERIELQVESWMSGVDDIKMQAEQFFNEEGQSQTRCSRTSCPNLCSCYQLSRRAKKMALKVKDLAKKKKDLNKVSHLPSPKCRHLIDDKMNEGLDSRLQIIDQVMEALRNSSINMVGLCGLGGIGKTTIAKEVAKKLENKKMFRKVIMVTISKDMNIVEIQRQIVEMLGMRLEEVNEEVRSSRLFDRLKQEENMLPILDDLWGELDFGKVGIPFIGDKNNNKKNEGCKILLTSRNKTLLSDVMKCEKIIGVGVLQEEEAQELFKRIAELSIESSNPGLMSIAGEIVQKCGGLPLAIVTAAKALRNKDQNIWEDALTRLRNPLRRNITGIKEVDQILRLSYDQLTKENQHIFLFSSMLSHDPLIQDLLMYSVGLGFLKHIENMEDARVGISAVVSKLKSLNLFLDSFSSQHFTIHDVIRDVALSIASNELCAFIWRHKRLNAWPEQNLLEGYKGICLEKSDIRDLPEELLAPRLEFFLLNSENRDLAIPDTFFKSTKDLKLLSFINVCFSSLPFLNSLKKLKTLCLHSCLLKDMTQVGSLKQLTTLSLAYSEIEHLPFELAMLTSLQMLNLAHCTKLKVIPPKLLSSWEKLEVLSMENSFNQWEAKGSSECNVNASLVELKDLPISSLDICIPDPSILPENLFSDKKLKRYRIIIGENWRWDCNHETSKTLKLELNENVHSKHGVQKLLEGVEDLYLCGSNGLEHVLHNRFPYLRHLQIKSNDDVEYIVLSSTHQEVALPMLETLNLEKLNVLKKLCQGPIAPTFFQNLKVIKVSGCQQLKWIFSASMIGSFSQLVEIEIRDCDSLKEVVTSAIEDSSDQPKFANDVIVFKKLRTLKMERLPVLIDFYMQDRAANNHYNTASKSLFNNKVLFQMLELLELSDLDNLISSIWNDQPSDSSFSNLKRLDVDSCGFVVLVPFQVLRSLHSLEELAVGQCENLEVVFDLDDLNDCKERQSSSVVLPLKKLSLWSLPKLKNVWSNHHQGNVSFQSLSQIDSKYSLLSCNKVLFPMLERLELSDLDNLTSSRWNDQLFDSSVSNLKRLFVWSCGFVILVPFQVLRSLHSLEELEVEECEKLEVVFYLEDLNNCKEPQSSSVVVPLKKLRLSRLPKLKNVWGNQHQENVSFQSLRQIEVVNCDSLMSVFPASITKGMLHCLEQLEVQDCADLEVIVAKDQVSESLDAACVCPRLTSLELFDLPNLRNFYAQRHKLEWPNVQQLEIDACGEIQIFEKVSSSSEIHREERTIDSIYPLLSCNKDDRFSVNLFSNLKELVVERCGSMRLVPFQVIRSLNSLEELQVTDCEKLEVVFDLEDLNDCEEGQSSSVVVPLKKLILEDLPKLKNVWSNHHRGNVSFQTSRQIDSKNPLLSRNKDDRFSVNLFSNLKELDVGRCGFVILVPFQVLRSLHSLEVLLMNGCEELEVVFNLEDLNDCKEGQSSSVVLPLKNLSLWNLPKLKNVWSNHHRENVSFQSLRQIEVVNCGSLTSVFPASIARGMLHCLEQLVVRNCADMEVIVATDQVSESLDAAFVCPRLTCLEFKHLPNLRNFYAQRHKLEWPHLHKLFIDDCDEIELFEKDVSSSSEVHGKEGY
ncbi:disease resistance protein At4g27190-like isoform X2 [Prosopis cineraria]|uniref:disease resistance protein At4g27190-like isoform X2 n=1 Tax=Prosopis cineraria TaxID=364024 RepID=UPI002410A72B|nr:disease resistance protein At4g27190-like isoform X2 [Prosopis cineraria]